MTIVATPIATPGDATPVQAIGNMYQCFLQLTFSGNYSTGGDAFDPTPFFPEGIGGIICVDMNGIAGYGYEYDKVNKKLKLFGAANTELVAGAYNAALTGDTNAICQVFAK